MGIGRKEGREKNKEKECDKYKHDKEQLICESQVFRSRLCNVFIRCVWLKCILIITLVSSHGYFQVDTHTLFTVLNTIITSPATIIILTATVTNNTNSINTSTIYRYNITWQTLLPSETVYHDPSKIHLYFIS